MKIIKEFSKKALVQYEDLRDTISVIEAMKIQGSKPGITWNSLKNKLHARHN
ncbi:hypothetical protein HZC21_05600 [Candidatus Peregrinibacteria bacterium]|nr:hypothetical protein [Candidatus Peregrinibacteria bacterium]